MTLKHETQSLLESGGDSSDVIDLVRRFKSDGTSQREAYDALQDLWAGYGFDDDDQAEPNRIRNELEHAMEVVWGFCPEATRIWDTSLSNERQPT
jgi:hypothetical protein